jgi:hypothetical protein
MIMQMTKMWSFHGGDYEEGWTSVLTRATRHNITGDEILQYRWLWHHEEFSKLNFRHAGTKISPLKILLNKHGFCSVRLRNLEDISEEQFPWKQLQMDKSPATLYGRRRQGSRLVKQEDAVTVGKVGMSRKLAFTDSDCDSEPGVPTVAQLRTMREMMTCNCPSLRHVTNCTLVCR